MKNYGSKIYRTDENGEITIVVNNKGKIRVEKTINKKDKTNKDKLNKSSNNVNTN